MNAGFDGLRISAASYLFMTLKMNDQYCGPRLPPAVLLFERPKMYAQLGTSCKVADTHGFGLPSISPAIRLPGSEKI
jgi:hypothetical protein